VTALLTSKGRVQKSGRESPSDSTPSERDTKVLTPSTSGSSSGNFPGRLLHPRDEAPRPPATTVRSWSSIVLESELVNHLLNVYFTYHQPLFPVLPERLVRADMASGQTTYCSPTLMNAMLATACTMSSPQDSPQASRGKHPTDDQFVAESHYLLMNDTTPRLTTIAALILLAMLETLKSRHDNACGLVGRASRMALCLGIHKPDLVFDDVQMQSAGWQLYRVCLQVDT
jgi:hypothetical protein